MSSDKVGMPVSSTRPSRAASRSEASRIAAAPAPKETLDPVVGGSSSGPVTSKLSAKKGPAKVQLNTRVHAATNARLDWFIRKHGYAVTDVVEVALQELFERHDVPQLDADGNLVER